MASATWRVPPDGEQLGRDPEGARQGRRREPRPHQHPRTGIFHDDLGIYKEENGSRVYDFTKSDLIFDFLVENGVQPIVELGSMPSALASDPSLTWFLWKMGTSPPKDFTLWQELIFKFAEHSLQRYGADVVSKWYWEVWNEPECCHGQFWDGTLDQYFELYDHALAGVTKAIPNAKVGGPVASQPVELTGNSELGKKFLEHVTKDSYVTPGQPGRVDVFMYHSWSFLDGAINGYFTGLDLLDSYGLENTPIAITEFGPTWEFNLHDEPQENEHGAAFVAQTYADIAQRCAKDNKRFPLTYAWWTLSDIFKEDNYRDGEPFIGAMGLISRENLHKPAYNAYKFLAQMGHEQVALTTGGSAGLGGMAARDERGGVQILVYNGQSPGKGRPTTSTARPAPNRTSPSPSPASTRPSPTTSPRIASTRSTATRTPCGKPRVAPPCPPCPKRTGPSSAARWTPHPSPRRNPSAAPRTPAASRWLHPACSSSS